MSQKLMIAACVALGLMTACRSEEANDVAVDNGSETSANEMSANEVAAAPAASEFAALVAASDMYEIESGKLAMERASSPDLKRFAGMLVQDHQKSTADLKTAAGNSSPQITVMPTLDSEKQSLIDTLKAASGADFDRTFIAQQKQAHGKALNLLRQYESGGENQSLREFAAKAAQVVQGHLDRLNAMEP